MRRDSAFMAAKPPIARGVMVASVPPAIMTSASPYWIRRAASPMECVPRRAGGHGAGVRALGAETDRDLAGDEIDDDHRDEERRDPAGATRSVHLVVLFDRLESADSRADVHADAVRLARAEREPGVVHRHLGRRQRVVDERVHLLDLFGVDEVGGVEVLDLGGDPAVEEGRIESRDAADARLPSDEGGPGLLDARPEGVNGPNP